jgi:hypothetical protein
VSQGLTEAFRSDETPPFGDMVARLFGNSNPQQRAGLLTQLTALGSVGAAGGGGPLGGLIRQLGGWGSAVTPEQAGAVTPDQVQQAVTHAEQQNPSIVERVSDFYAQHPAFLQLSFLKGNHHVHHASSTNASGLLLRRIRIDYCRSNPDRRYRYL